MQPVKIAQRFKDIQPSPMTKIFQAAEGVEGLINLSIGEPDFHTEHEIVDAAAAAAKLRSRAARPPSRREYGGSQVTWRNPSRGAPSQLRVMSVTSAPSAASAPSARSTKRSAPPNGL